MKYSSVFDFVTGQNVNMFLTLNAGGAGPRFAITNTGAGGEQRLTYGGQNFPLNQWSNVVVTVSGTQGTMYLNGTVVATNPNMTVKPSALGNTNRNYLGKSQYGDPAYDGAIDDFAVYDRALSAADVAALAGGRAAAGTVAQYAFDEASGAALQDSSGNNRNGTIVLGTDGATTSTATDAQTADRFWTLTPVAVADTTKPAVTLVSPTTAGPFSALAVQVDATDDRGLKRIVANIYKDGKLVTSTQSPVAGGARTGSHSAPVQLPDGNYTVKYNAEPLAGNIAPTKTFAVTLDSTAPTATVKTEPSFTTGEKGVYDQVSFKLYDAGRIDRAVINGRVKDLTDNAWSDVNFIKPGVFGAVKGANTMVVHDVAGNTTTVQFTLN
ncbi:hypothetical protein C5C33_02310 [Rathayibacter sp. AY1H3]|nr:LamG domain-containing protein [Rathayibacter sp. AY1H3]PPH09740.1 hypothetical protein C5C33_02310 [Rathayibacter sp. AY1H3]